MSCIRPPKYAPGEKQDDKDKTYFVMLVCSNCDQKYDFYIPKGETIRDYCINKRCDNCGCTKLGKR